MKKTIYTIKMPYEYHPERRGTKYKIGDAFKNSGEFLESVAKFHRGLAYETNPATAWNEGSDIETEHASVKSSKASLASIYGSSLEEILQEYFSHVPSTKWIWMVQIDDQAIEYEMNKTEFQEFCNRWLSLGSESGSHKQKARFATTTGKMIRWLEERV